MGYRKIPNLYRPEASGAILPLTEVYALEKIHGTSAHVAYNIEDGIRFFSGGIKNETFLKMLDEKFGGRGVKWIESTMKNCVTCLPNIKELCLFGEAYGGKCQKMTDVYGPLNFVVFEVKMKYTNDTERWLSVPDADAWAAQIGFEFVHFEKGPATVEWLDSERDKPSVQAARNGMGVQYGEGIVIRSTDETIRDRVGNRIIAKYKREAFSETKTPRKVDPNQQKVWKEAETTAEEWVVDMRLDHVLDALKADGVELELKNMRAFIGAMIGDVRKESGADGPNPEIEWSNAIQKAISTRTANMVKARMNKQLETQK